MEAPAAAALPGDLPVRRFATVAAWDRWLSTHPGAAGLWLKIAKKDGGATSIGYAEALDVALCHGWIDGQKRACDARFFLQRFTPRRPGSVWSKINVGKAEALIAAGRMREGGLREVEAARADGRWAAAYESASRMQVPAELEAALAGDPAAQAFFDQLDRTNRYAFCWRVQTAKKAETRVARAERFAAMLARGEKLHG
ncbi:YdeI/OmpD-associated family protein [Marilutibacter chinensis]|uniref:YdeI/OmpD-associated family protein n=1 Tax=Marilutibacter chinensis TaxID=2912247 RepID=A0ABS9HQK5_9GAMM|nr:YdeI/OmpD-associated family protein [Lysobacter chinensis]MCF7220796.1 YdeI/OmpD-associated family protein [Lysobacter chinensis]